MNTYKQLEPETKRTASSPVGKLVAAWDDYWFYPAPLFNLAICRIVAVVFQLHYLLSKGYAGRLISQADIPGRTFSPVLAFQALDLPFPWQVPPTGFLLSVFGAAMVSGITSLLGLRTRLSLLVFALTNLYIQTYLYSFGSFHHGEAILLIVFFLLAFGPSGKALSWDDFSWQLRQNLRRKSVQAVDELRRASMFARWPLLVTQWLFALIYLSAAINKVNADGPGLLSARWMNGYTLQYYLMSDGLKWGSDLGIWLAQFHFFSIISSWFAVIFEAAFWLVLPFPQLIWLFIPLGFALHIGIWMAQRAPFFHYLALYAVFIPWAALFKRLAHRFGWYKNNGKVSCFYSAQQRSSLRLATFIAYFDWFNRIEYLDLATQDLKSYRLEASLDQDSMQQTETGSNTQSEALYWMGKQGEVKHGFDALREGMGYCPLLWPLKWLSSVSIAQALFERAYQFAVVKR